MRAGKINAVYDAMGNNLHKTEINLPSSGRDV